MLHRKAPSPRARSVNTISESARFARFLNRVAILGVSPEAVSPLPIRPVVAIIPEAGLP